LEDIDEVLGSIERMELAVRGCGLSLAFIAQTDRFQPLYVENVFAKPYDWIKAMAFPGGPFSAQA